MEGSSTEGSSKSNDQEIQDLEEELRKAEKDAGGSSSGSAIDVDDMDIETANAIAIAQAATEDMAGGSSASSTGVKSYRCKATGKLFRSMRDVELYAERTGHDDFEETDM